MSKHTDQLTDAVLPEGPGGPRGPGGPTMLTAVVRKMPKTYISAHYDDFVQQFLGVQLTQSMKMDFSVIL